MSGKLYGIGVGPGDPELLTLKAHRLLTSAKIVAYPSPDNGESFARSIVAQFLRTDQLEYPIVIPMRVERFPAQSVYDQAADDLSKYLSDGHDVVVLCEGDPFFYGSFMYLYERLSSKFECEIVPGVSSLMASASMLGRPLAARNDVLTIVPGPSDDKVIAAHLRSSDAIAFIKVGRHLDRLRRLIGQAGLSENAAYLERVTLDNQKIMPLSKVSAKDAPYFSIILIYRGAEDWISQLPMEGEVNA